DYDSGGRLIKVTDAAGTVTLTGYDGASRLITKTVKDALSRSPDRVTRLFYDGDGKNIGMLDPLGYLSEKKYDVRGRLVETIRYATRSPGIADTAPVWKGVASQNVSIGRPFVYHMPAASDVDGDVLTYSVVSKPSWVTFDASGITLSGTPPKGFTTASVVLK